MGRSRENKAVPVFFVTLELLTPTLPRYKTEAKKLKEKTEEAASSETEIKFSIHSFSPKFLQLSMLLSLRVM